MVKCYRCQGELVDVVPLPYTPAFPVYCGQCQAEEDTLAAEYEQYIQQKTRQHEHTYTKNYLIRQK